MVEISDQELAQLRGREQKYRAIIDQSTDGIMISDQDGNVDVWNAGMVALTGIAEKEALGRPLWEVQSRLIPKEQATPELLEQIKNGCRQLLEAKMDWPGESREQAIACADGTRKIVQDSSFLIKANGTVRIGSILRDITERKKAVEELRNNEEKYRLLFETLVQGVVYQAADGKIISVNPAAERILGLTLDQMKGRSSVDPRWKSTHEDGSDFPGETHPAMTALKTGREVRNVIMGVFNPKNDSHHWININAVPLFKPGENKPYQVYATFEDITERRQAERELLLKNSVFDESIAANSIADLSGTITQVNEAFLRLWGCSGKAEVVGKPLSSFFNEQNEAVAVVDSLNKGKHWEGDFTAKRKDGSTFIAHALATVVRGKGDKMLGYQSTVMDVTERKKADDELKQKVKELEKTTRIMEGREDRIIELKARVKELEGRLQTEDHRPKT